MSTLNPFFKHFQRAGSTPYAIRGKAMKIEDFHLFLLVLKMGFLTTVRRLIPLAGSTGRKEKTIDEKQHSQ